MWICFDDKSSFNIGWGNGKQFKSSMILHDKL